MSDKLNDAESWLPSEILTEEDIVMDSYGVLGSSRLSNKHASFTSSTGSNSPVESTETLSDKGGDSLESELTQLLTLLRASRLSQSNQNHEKKGFELPGSGLLAFTGLKSGSGQSIMTYNGNPNGFFQVSSHATAPCSGNEDVWDLIYKAASQVAKNNGGFEAAFARNPVVMGQQRIHKPPYPQKPSVHSSLYLNQLARDEILLEQELWITQEKNRLILEQSYMKVADVSESLAGGFTSSFTSTAPDYPRMNQQFRPNSGVRSGLHLADRNRFGPAYGSGTGKTERVGTGVFLPRRYGTTTGADDSSGNGCNAAVRPTRKKTGYASIGYEPKGNPIMTNIKNNPNPSGLSYSPTTQPRFIGGGGGLTGDNEASVMARKATTINHDVCLPQEWTY